MERLSSSKSFLGIQNFIIAGIIRNSLYQFCLFMVILVILSVGMIYWYFPDTGIVTSGGSDLQFHANRFYAIVQAIDYNTFPFYINTEALNHYGYAANLFYPDLMLIPFALLAPSIGFATAYKLMIFVYTLLCGIFSFGSLSRITKDNLIACLFSLLYTFALYRIIDISYRGALGEFISFTFVPLVFWGLYEILYGDFKQRWYIISIGFICLIYTHLLSALLIFITVCIGLVICYKSIKENPYRLLYLVLAGAVSAIVSSAFLLPMFEQLNDNSFYFQTHPLAEAIGPQSVELKRVLWGVFNGLTDNRLRIETIGIILIIPLFFRLAITGNHRYLRAADSYTFVSFILIFALSDIFPWYIFPFNKLAILQFPFRLLQPASFLLAFSGAVYLSIISRKTNRRIIIVACLIIIIGYSIRLTGGVYQGYIKYTVDNTVTHNLDQLEIVGAEYLSSKVPSVPTEDIRYRIDYVVNRKDSVKAERNTIIKNRSREKDKLRLETEQSEPDNLVLPLLYYKGYRAVFDNSKELTVSQSEDGLIEIESPASSQIIVWYDGTLAQRVGLSVSLVSLLALLLYIVYIERQSNKLKNNKKIKR